MSKVTTRPEPPHAAPAGTRWVIAPDSNWRTVTVQTGRCRMVNGYGRKACGARAVAEIRRTRHSYRLSRTYITWWKYCEEHIRDYGCWIEVGMVVRWRLDEADWLDESGGA